MKIEVDRYLLTTDTGTKLLLTPAELQDLVQKGAEVLQPAFRQGLGADDIHALPAVALPPTLSP